MTNERNFERIESLFDIAVFANVKVLVAGCGSGGSNVALQLVMSGIRKFTLIDNDILGPENVIRESPSRSSSVTEEVGCVASRSRNRSVRPVVAVPSTTSVESSRAPVATSWGCG